MSFQGKSGLFALLPPPQHASIKETNRALIPHTLTKKQTAPPKALKKPLGTAMVGPQKPGQQDSDSDGEDQPASFFSLDSQDNTTPTLPGFSSKKLSLPPPVVASANQTENLVLGSSSSLRDSAAFGGSVDSQRGSFSSQAGPVPMETSLAAGNFEHGSDETEVRICVSNPVHCMWCLYCSSIYGVKSYRCIMDKLNFVYDSFIITFTTVTYD